VLLVQKQGLDDLQSSAVKVSKSALKFGMEKVDEVRYRIEPTAREGMKVPVTIYSNEDLISKMQTDRTIDQAVNVTYLPGVKKHVIVLPDGHEGYGFPIGGVAATDFDTGVISPGGVGYDINCGVRLVRTNLHEKDIRPKLKELVRELFVAVPSGLGSRGAINLSSTELDKVLSEGVEWAVRNDYATPEDLEFCEENGRMAYCDPSKVSDLARKRGAKSLGTLGSGNHFLEVDTINEIMDEDAAKIFGIASKDQVCFLIHCGSRGLGHQICSDYLRIAEAVQTKYNIILPDRELACAPAGSKEAENYRLAMGCALNYAWTNRQMITHRVRKAFERVMQMSEDDLRMKLVYDVAHNICKVEEHSVDFDDPKKKRKVFVHRKGATRAFPKGSEVIPQEYRKAGQPVFIPGSMGTASWVLLGKEESMLASFGSTAHGAGRMLSRAAASRQYPYSQVKHNLEERGIVLESASKRGITEEAPGAYKDVDIVAEVSHRAGIASKVVRLTPIAVVKG
jgi:tRNA-splicing ligase RtcB (3'-phosphate/5'-hydroxy nucleic acid ligase)